MTAECAASAPGGPPYVSLTKLGPAAELEASPRDLNEAEPLYLLHVAASSASAALVSDVLPIVEAHEGRTRKRQRGASERRNLVEAIAAVLGGVLEADLLRGVPVYRQRDPDAFIGLPVGRRAALPALDALADAGLLAHTPGIRFSIQFEGFAVPGGRASRYSATDALRHRASAFGISPDNIGRHFERRFAAKPVNVADVDLVTLRGFRDRPGAARGKGPDPRLPIPPDEQRQARAIAAEVKAVNAVLTSHHWAGCPPPALYRAFRGSLDYGGRWIVAGFPPFQSFRKAERLAVLVDGAPVSSVDVTASQLAILGAAAGACELPGDPYQVEGYTRDVVKGAIVAALGSGGLPRVWPVRMLADRPQLRGVALKPLTALLHDRYPFLDAAPEVLGVEKAKVSLRLQAIEARCLTMAMRGEWSQGVPVLPVHDEIICPSDRAEHVTAALVEAYKAEAGAIVRCKVTNAADVA